MGEDDEGGNDRWDGYFTAFRPGGFPTQYGPARTPVTVDVLEIGFVFAALLLIIAFALTLPGIRGWVGKLKSTLKYILVIWVTLFIFLCNFGQEWEISHLHTKTQYRAGTNHEINADIEVKIGLRSVNITLLGTPEYQNTSYHETERINYNERFEWHVDAWQQGRIGFGPFSFILNQEFRAAQLRGCPYPILWIAEYFTIDGEGIRWGRYYRQAGFYAHILLWLAFPCWILGLLLLQSAIVYGIAFIWLTGLCHIVACLVFASVRNPNELKIPFEDGLLEFKWGWTFGMCIINGLICIVMGIVLLIFDYKFPDATAEFLGADRLNEFEEYYVSADELKRMGIKVDQRNSDGSSGHTSSTGSFGSIKRILSKKNRPQFITPGFDPKKDDQENRESERDSSNPDIQVFRRRTRTGGVGDLANKVRKTILKRNPQHVTTVPVGRERPDSEMMPPDMMVDPIAEEPGFDISIVDKPHATNEWKVMPVGTTIRAKTQEDHQEKRRNKDLETHEEGIEEEDEPEPDYDDVVNHAYEHAVEYEDVNGHEPLENRSSMA